MSDDSKESARENDILFTQIAQSFARHVATIEAEPVKQPSKSKTDTKNKLKEKSVRQQIDEATKMQSECRFKGVTKGLYRLSELDAFKEARSAGTEKDSYTVVLNSRRPLCENKNQHTRNTKEFVERFNKAAPFFSDGLPAGFIVAGGAVQCLINNMPIEDIDLFMVGLTKGQAEDRIDLLAAALYEQFKTMQVHRSSRCVTFVGGGYRVQVILQRYSSIAEILYGFDIGSCSAAYDGTQVFFSAMGKLAFEVGLNVVSMDGRRGTYESRLAKYWNRGYGLVLKEFKRPANDDHQDIELPWIEFIHCDYMPVPNRLICRDIHVPSKIVSGEISKEETDAFYNYVTEPNDFALHNFSVAVNISDDKIMIPKLVAHTTFGKDTFVADIGCDFKRLGSSLEMLADPTHFQLARLTRLVGDEVVQAIVKYKGQDRRQFMEKIASTLVASIAARVVIPYEFTEVADGDLLTAGVKSKTLASDWYGSYYRAPEISKIDSVVVNENLVSSIKSNVDKFHEKMAALLDTKNTTPISSSSLSATTAMSTTYVPDTDNQKTIVESLMRVMMNLLSKTDPTKARQMSDMIARIDLVDAKDPKCESILRGMFKEMDIDVDLFNSSSSSSSSSLSSSSIPAAATTQPKQEKMADALDAKQTAPISTTATPAPKKEEITVGLQRQATDTTAVQIMFDMIVESLVPKSATDWKLVENKVKEIMNSGSDSQHQRDYFIRLVDAESGRRQQQQFKKK